MESDVVTMQDIFIAKPVEDAQGGRTPATACSARCAARGIKPQFLDKMSSNGVNLPAELLPAGQPPSGCSSRRSRVFGRAVGQ